MFCYCAQTRRLARLLAARYDEALAPAGLTAAQFELLSTLGNAGPVHGRALADLLAVDTTTLSRNLKAMMVAGLVQAAASKADARQLLYAPTTQGGQRLRKALPLWQAVHDSTAKQLGEDAKSTRKTLQRMSESLLATA